MTQRTQKVSETLRLRRVSSDYPEEGLGLPETSGAEAVETREDSEVGGGPTGRTRTRDLRHGKTTTRDSLTVSVNLAERLSTEVPRRNNKKDAGRAPPPLVTNRSPSSGGQTSAKSLRSELKLSLQSRLGRKRLSKARFATTR